MTGAEIRALRHRLGMTQLELSRKIGVDPSQVGARTDEA